MSYGLSCVVSDIPANREVALDDARYVKPGDVDALADKLNTFAAKPLNAEEKAAQIRLVAEKYNWGNDRGKDVGSVQQD